MPKKEPVYDQQCPHCEKKLTVKGLPGHIAFKHSDKLKSGASANASHQAQSTGNAPAASGKKGFSIFDF